MHSTPPAFKRSAAHGWRVTRKANPPYISASAHLTDVDSALTGYVELHVSFVRIHPFCDGNGRMARLLANLPVLRSGSPPIILPKEKRREYIGLLAAYELATGTATTHTSLLPQPELLTLLRMFCVQAWQASTELVEQAQREQRKRERPVGDEDAAL